MGRRCREAAAEGRLLVPLTRPSATLSPLTRGEGLSRDRRVSLERGIRVIGKKLPASTAILSDDAMSFVAKLHRQFNLTREKLLARRGERQKDFDAGKMPDFLPETKSVRDGDWKVATTPPDLQKRWVEIT